MKNFIPTPSIGLKKRLGRDFKIYTIYTIDEYNTSKKCFSCGSDNENKIKIEDPRMHQKEKKERKNVNFWELIISSEAIRQSKIVSN
jgi:hypothetical protein